MELLTKFVKNPLSLLKNIINIALASLLLLSIGWNFYLKPADKFKTRDFCTYIYKIDEDVISICSTEKLSKRNILKLEKQTVRGLQLYKKFMNNKGYGDVKYSIPILIYIMDVETLNTDPVFFRKGKKKVVGRYTAGGGRIYISFEALQKIGRTDLSHELAHYGNDNLGLSNNDLLDENLAKEFEGYYMRHVD